MSKDPVMFDTNTLRMKPILTLLALSLLAGCANREMSSWHD